ncbi:hypothetical protein KA082_03030 [Candidatus Woesebacteria bacterium]|nr:hypothetical protein [Candidatus Woesebacteria bacterium]
MSKILQLFIIIFAVTSVAIGDVFIKKATLNANFTQALTSKWMLLAIGCYLFQILIFAWMFVKGWDLGIVGSLQTVFYAAVVLSVGYFWFSEKLAPMQMLGIALALAGVMLINWFSKA